MVHFLSPETTFTGLMDMPGAFADSGKTSIAEKY
jgi:hypothetical protein